MRSVHDPALGHTPAAPRSLNEAERQALLAARMESARLLAGGIAHDLNNILTAVLGFGTLLAQQLSDPSASKSAHEVLSAGERGAALARQLLAFSGRQVLSPQRVNIDEVVEDARSLMQEAAGAAVALEIHSQGSVPSAQVDVDGLRAALVVLADNAKDAMPKGGRLIVEVDTVLLDESYAAQHLNVAAGPYVRISLSDTGCGIPFEIRDRVFEPFFTTKARGKGVGLGLATVYGFVRQSGGNISVYSEPDIGTTFKMYLPAFEITASVVQKSVTPAPAGGAGQTVLVVDDVDAVRALASDALRRAGYRVIVAASASDALYMAGSQRGPIHVLLTDVIMPGSNGVDLARELRTERRGLRVLYMSGYPDHVVVRNDLLAAGEAFLQKPFSRELLLEKVAALVR